MRAGGLPVFVASLALALLLTACGSSRSLERAATERSVRLAEAIAAFERNDVTALADELRSQLNDAGSSGGRVDPLLFDAYISRVDIQRADLELLTAAFLNVIGSASSYEDVLQASAAARHIALTELLSTEFRGIATEHERYEATRGWWISQDNRPSSPGIERLRLHLERLASARAHYTSHTSPTGLDDRGNVLVRFGEPARQRHLSLRDGDLLRTFQNDGIAVSGNDLPAAEFWAYDHIHGGGIYLFVAGRNGDDHRIGEVNDLLPRQLRNRGISGSPRGGNIAFAALKTLRQIYSELALFHPAFSGRFETISNFVGWHEERAIGERGGGHGSGVVLSFDAATRTYAAAIDRNDREDRRIAERRESAMPPQYAGDYSIGLPVSARSTRFLNDQRETIVDIHWRPEFERMPQECMNALRENSFAWRARLVSYGGDVYRRQAIEDLEVMPSDLTPGPHRIRARVPQDARYMALQVDQRARSTTTAGESIDRICTGVFRPGDTALLEASAQSTLISDLLPFVVDDVVVMRETLRTSLDRDGLDVITGNDIGSAGAIGVYFEVYSLLDLEDDIIVEYEVVKRRRGSLLQRTRTSSSMYQAARAGVSGRLPAAFLVDRKEWEGADEIDVAVTVTNVVTGETVARSETFLVGQ